MNDTISRNDAIDAVKRNTFRLTIAEEQNGEGHVAWSAEAVYSDVMEGELLDLPPAQPERWDTCFSCPLSHGCPFIKGCTNDQAEQYAGEIPTDCPLDKESAQFEPNCKGCKHEPRFSHEEPCCTCANNYENKYER